MILWCNVCNERPANYSAKVIGDWVKPKPLNELKAEDLIPLDVCYVCFETEIEKVGDGKLEV